MQALKLIGTLRGAGALLSGAVSVKVTYAIDLYRRGQTVLAGGEADGRMSTKFRGSTACRLRLANGEVVGVSIRDVEQAFAAFDVDLNGAIVCHDLWAGKAETKTESAPA